MKNHYKFLLALLGAATLISCSSNEVSEQRPDTPEVESRAEHSESQPLPNEADQPRQGSDEYAVGSRLENPRTPTLEYDALIDANAGTVSIAKYKKYENSFDDYLKVRVNGTRGKVFEAAVAYQANQHLKSAGRPERVLTTAVEGDPGHAADNLLWSDNQIIKSYQLKSTKNRKQIASFLSDKKYTDKYDDEIIIVHPETLADIKQVLQRRKLSGKPPSGDLTVFEIALNNGRLSDEVIPGLKVPSYTKMHAEADRAIRRQFAYARSRFGAAAKTTLLENSQRGNASDIVYVTTSGKKYHREDCRHLRKSKHPLSLKDARETHGPCKSCKPPN